MRAWRALRTRLRPLLADYLDLPIWKREDYTIRQGNPKIIPLPTNALAPKLLTEADYLFDPCHTKNRFTTIGTYDLLHPTRPRKPFKKIPWPQPAATETRVIKEGEISSNWAIPVKVLILHQVDFALFRIYVRPSAFASFFSGTIHKEQR